jgi:hypothetical protein
MVLVNCNYHRFFNRQTKLSANLYICMTKSYKANPKRVDWYDCHHTLFIFKCISFLLTNHQMGFLFVKLNSVFGKSKIVNRKSKSARRITSLYFILIGVQ